MSTPKVTYALLCYKQEKFVRDAARSALAQDLTPLDIILSDDCSPDGTFEILEEEAKNYRGPNSVRLNRNDVNLGIEHNNKMVQMAKGDLIIIAHGDDIAAPHRARRVAEAWQKTGASVLSSNVWVVDDTGKPLGILSNETESHMVPMEQLTALAWKKSMLGATLAVGREVFTEFEWLDKQKVPVGTDHILPFRGALLGGMYFIAEPLMYWRQHAMNMGDLVGDKTGGELVYRETYLGYRAMRGSGMMRDLVHLVARRGRQPRLVKIGRALELQLLKLFEDWIEMRNQLYLEGMRPTWVDKAELEKRTINVGYRVWPDITTSDIPAPPTSGKARHPGKS